MLLIFVKGSVSIKWKGLILLHEQTVNSHHHCFGFLGQHWFNDNSGVLDKKCHAGKAGCI